MSKQNHLKPRQLNRVKIYDIWDEMVLYAPEREMAYALNSSARAIWELCDGRHTLVEMSQELGQRFGCSAEDLFADVQTTITQLHELGLLGLEEASGTR